MLKTIGATALIIIVISAIVYTIYWRTQHPCIRYQAVYVQAWTEIETRHIDCGKNCSQTIVVPVFHPAYWDQRCMAFGDRSKGDIEADYAPIPAENGR